MKSRIVILVSLLVLLSCTNDEENTFTLVPNGNYTGTFTVTYSDGTTHTNAVTINFSEPNNYNSSGNGNNNEFYPAGGSGTFEMTDTKMRFSDTNIWLAHFDWNLILNGEYDYFISGDQLTISASKNDVGFYKYELRKE